MSAKPLDVYGPLAAQALLGVSKQRLYKLMATDPAFPKPRPIQHPGEQPQEKLASGPLWDGPELRAYAAKARPTGVYARRRGT